MDATRQSLLLRAKAGEESAWESLTALYRPLILGWLNRQGVPTREREDISQDVLLSVVKNLSAFQHSGRKGAFRCWLRTILSSRTADFWRANVTDGPTSNGSVTLQQVADPDSDLNRQWDDEHDRYILQCLLDVIEEEFEPKTLRAFRRLAIDGLSGEETAHELGMSLAAVYVAKSRVLRRIRQDAEGLID